MEASPSFQLQPSCACEREGNNNNISELIPEKEVGKLGLRKRILRKGNSWQSPSQGDEVEGKNVFDIN